MVGVAQRQHVDIAGIGLRHDQRKIDRLGAAVGEVDHPIVALGHARGQLFGVVRRHGVIKHGRAVLQLLDLVLDGGRHRGMNMADRNAHVHAKKVDILLAPLVP